MSKGGATGKGKARDSGSGVDIRGTELRLKIEANLSEL